MSTDEARTKPSVLQYIAYCYGRRLPDTMRDWVINDLTGKGATKRHILRVTIPAILVLAPFWLIPTSLYVHLSMTVPIFLPFLYFAHALDKIWRRHRVLQHGLDPALLDVRARRRDAHKHEAYAERYGPRT